LGPNTVFNEPLFYLVMKETADEPSGLGKALATPGIYITFISANLRKKNDSGNEEFEVGYSDGPNVTYDAFNATSALRFDGVSRLDAAGVTRLFPDINTATLYTAQQPIAMRKLDGIGAPSAWRLIATEDDAAVGEFYRYSGEFNGYKPADYYDMADDYLKLNLNSKFNFHDFGSGSFDLDDIYTKTGIMNINEDNVSDRLGLYLFKDTDNNLSGIPLGDINWRFGMVTY
ncbi:hypothetical protein HUU42_10500, partial [bacterium]|nr:hypothetical protein [bacterium]